MKISLLLALLSFAAASARAESALLLKETTPAYTPSQTWSWCRVFADRVELTGETDGTKAEPISRPVAYDAAVKDLAALEGLIARADAPAPAKTVTTDSGEVRHYAYAEVPGAAPKAITLKVRGDEEATNPTEAAAALVGFLDRSCAAAAESEAESSFPDSLSLSCSFSTPNGSQGLSFKPAEGAAEANSGDSRALCEPLKGNRAACSILDASGKTLARKVFDPSAVETSIEAGQSLRLLCRANS